MKRDELWRSQYRSRRYMAHLTDDEVEQRFFDVFNNAVDVTGEGKLAPTGFAVPSLFWLETQTHLIQEFEIRGLSLPAGDRQAMSLFRTDRYNFVRAANAVSALPVKPPYLVRYASRARIEDMIEHGSIRISPASTYADPSLGPARSDDEIAQSIDVHAAGGRLHLQDDKTKEWQEIAGIRQLKWVTRAPSDYLVYCMAARLSPRLFADFDGSDACLVIRDPAEFAARIIEAAQDIGFEFEILQGPVNYYDPLRADPAKVAPIFSKHFRFAYQLEWRFAWLPQDRSLRLTPQNLKLGPLGGIAEAVYL